MGGKIKGKKVALIAQALSKNSKMFVFKFKSFVLTVLSTFFKNGIVLVSKRQLFKVIINWLNIQKKIFALGKSKVDAIYIAKTHRH